MTLILPQTQPSNSASVGAGAMKTAVNLVTPLCPTDNLLLYGMTGSGKTTQLAELIRVQTQATGLKALAYVTDWGSAEPLRALQQAGCLDVETFQYGQDPFVWIEAAVQGFRLTAGKWVKPDHRQYCLGVFESVTGQGDLILNALGHQVAQGKGGDAMKAPALTIQSQNGVIRVPSNSPTHYGMAQKHLLERVWQAQLLPFATVWTAHEDIAAPEKRDDQGNIRAEVAVGPLTKGMIGPLVAGHALTMHLGKYFVFVFRLKQELTASGAEHVLLTERHKDGFYEGLATNRAPLGANIDRVVRPADVVRSLQQIQQARQALRLGLTPRRPA